MKPQILTDTFTGGYHNQDLSKSLNRLQKQKTYQDLSTICICPSRGNIPAKIVQHWLSLMTPMNQKFMRVFIIGMEVGAAYEQALSVILSNEEARKFKYILTIEEDNAPPPDGLLKLYENMDKFDVVGGLYWTKGEGGQPMCYGNPNVMPKNFVPQMPVPESLTECNGLGMGFTLFKMDIFTNKKFERPFFETVQKFQSGKGAEAYTQDLKFFEKASKLGYRFACDSRVKVGHYDINTDIYW